MIYLDHNATTRPLPEVVEAMCTSLTDDWANPSSRHAPGQAVRARIAEARAEVAALACARAVEVVFTSGATESNHHALYGALHRAGAPRRIVLSAIEHASCLKAALRLRETGVDVTLLPVDGTGRVPPEALCEALQNDAALVSVMAANNETGVLQPIAELAAIARARGVPFHVDATQLAGKLPLDLITPEADLMSLSAHKLYGPKGVGALVIRKGLQWPSLLVGSQERGRRGGTENVAGIVGFGIAAQMVRAALAKEAQRLTTLRDRLEAGLRKCFGKRLTVFGAGARLPNTSCIALAGLSADKVLDRLERRGIFAAAGAACTAGGTEPSHVLTTMGVPEETALGAVRLSLGRETSDDDVAATLAAFESLLEDTAAPLHRTTKSTMGVPE